MPAVISPNEILRLDAEVSNLGATSWNADPATPPVFLAYHVYGPAGECLTWDGLRTTPPGPVRSGEAVRVRARLLAPRTAGEYRVEWDMVREGVCWFAQQGSATCSANVRVEAADVTASGAARLEIIRRVPESLRRWRRPLSEVRVTIALRTWNVYRCHREDLLEATLRSLREAGHPYRLELVDNGSTDGTADLVKSLGGYAAPRQGENNPAGMGMNIAIERALAHAPDLVVFSDDDLCWKPGFLARLVRFWDDAPDDLALLGGFIEPQWEWNDVLGVLECGGMRVLLREAAPASGWTFLAESWPRFGPLAPGMQADSLACRRIRSAGLRIAQADLAEHIGVGRSTWGNDPGPGVPIDRSLLGD